MVEFVEFCYTSNKVPNSARERVVERGSPFWAEHRSRYHLAADYCAGQVVLDIACGAGYGCALLKESGARCVIGADLAWQAMADSSRSLAPGIQLIQADGTALPLASASVDIVTSFETLEHIPEFARFLQELRRVLKENGLLLLSTPNALTSKPMNGVPRNPFHIREFTPEELLGILQEQFSRVELRGQRVSYRFRPCPYWDGPEPPEKSLTARTKAVIWKLIARLPAPTRETAARALLGHSLYPGEFDFVFEAESTRAGHVLVAICRP
jgi:SAM-dependent methyltransferase